MSEEAEDASWDEFLQQIPTGQFQQSSIWAQAKTSENWSCVRVLIGSEERLMGGFQLLWRSALLGGIGYVSKGPVLERLDNQADTYLLEQYATALLKKVARRKKLHAVIVQPPDHCEEMNDLLREAGSMPELHTRVNDATWIVDLSDGFDAVERGMSSSFRRNISRASRTNLRVWEGERSDLASFFELMLSSCRRQNVRPNPGNLRHLEALWDAAHPRGAIRLYFVESDGEPITGHLDVLFGQTLTFWKKGWNGTAKRLAPNDVCVYEGLRWASEAGYSRCDFASFDRDMAVSLINGEALTEQQAHSRYLIFIRIGGRPMLLPRAQVLLPNPLLRAGYRLRYSRQIH